MPTHHIAVRRSDIVRTFYRTDWRDRWGWKFTEEVCAGRRRYVLLNNGAILPVVWLKVR